MIRARFQAAIYQEKKFFQIVPLKMQLFDAEQLDDFTFDDTI